MDVVLRLETRQSRTGGAWRMDYQMSKCVRKGIDIAYVYTYVRGELLPLHVVINRLFEPRVYTLDISVYHKSVRT